MELRDKIIKCLTGQSTMGAYDIATEVGSDYDTVTDELIVMEKKKLVLGMVRHGECDWKLMETKV